MVKNSIKEVVLYRLMASAEQTCYSVTLIALECQILLSAAASLLVTLNETAAYVIAVRSLSHTHICYV